MNIDDWKDCKKRIGLGFRQKNCWKIQVL